MGRLKKMSTVQFRCSTFDDHDDLMIDDTLDDSDDSAQG